MKRRCDSIPATPVSSSAREHWETALRLRPDYQDARRNLLLLEQRQHRP